MHGSCVISLITPCLLSTVQLTTKQSADIDLDLGPLEAGGLYQWRVRVNNSVVAGDQDKPDRAGALAEANVCQSDWSSNATFVVGLVHGFHNGSQPIWTVDGEANYAYFHGSFDTAATVTAQPVADSHRGTNSATSHLVKAVAFVTAVGDDRLLGAYRLFAGGKTASIGPGRGDFRYTELLNLVYDTVDVTDAANPTTGVLAVGLQCYHSNPAAAGVLLELHLHYSDGTHFLAGGTGENWKAFNANSVYNPTSKEGAYNAPQENIDANAYPDECSAGWKSLSQYSTVDLVSSGWQNATIAVNSTLSGVPGHVPGKPTPHLEVTEYRRVVEQVEIVPGTHWFFDFGTDFMGGINLQLDAGAFTGQTLQLTLSEELVNGTNDTVLYPMRTGTVWAT